MRKFLKNILFFLLPAIIVGISILIYENSLSNNYKIEPGISTIYIGDSHIQMAINDSIIPHSINLAAIAEFDPDHRRRGSGPVAFLYGWSRSERCTYLRQVEVFSARHLGSETLGSLPSRAVQNQARS